jgi:tRNA(fMet)-specific endonuclease VapC
VTLLDTDTMSLLMHGHSNINARLAQTPDSGTTIVSWIEILQGRFAAVLKAADASRLLQAQHRLRDNERFMNTLVILDFDERAGNEFDKLRDQKKLKKIGRADLLIASITLAHRATLVTRNLKHFQLVPGLKVENWGD